jgi:hypothetical protein
MLLLLENFCSNIEGDKRFDTPARVKAFTKEYLEANNALHEAGFSKNINQTPRFHDRRR